MTKFTKSQTDLVAAVIRNNRGMTKEAKIALGNRFAGAFLVHGTRFKFNPEAFKLACLFEPHNGRFIGPQDKKAVRKLARFTDLEIPESWREK